MEKISAYTQQDVVAALQWHLDMGIDAVVGDEPTSIHENFSEITPAPLAQNPQKIEQIRREMPTPIAVSAAPAPSLSSAISHARQLADTAQTIAALEDAIRSFEGCPLKKTSQNTVISQGVAHSRVMLVGEAPGAEEDKMGVPFCGPSGQLLDHMLSYIGLSRSENFMITNTVYWRPPGNRQPTDEETAICQPFVEKLIALHAPKILVAVGGVATKALLNDSRGVTKIRGQVFHYSNPYLSSPIPTHVIFHPSYLLRQPSAKREVWADLIQLKSALQALS
jgi:uracil-DNA glycosylase